MAEQVLAVDVDRDVTDLQDVTRYVRYAKVVKVYDADTLSDSSEYGKVDLLWLDTLDPVNGTVSISWPMYSTDHGCGIIALPQVNDIAICLHQQSAPPLVIGFLARKQFEAATTADPSGYGQTGYFQPIKSGEVMVKAGSQSFIYIKNDGTIRIVAKDGANKTTIVHDDKIYNPSPIFNRSVANERNTVVDLTLGNKTDSNGNSLGFGREVFDLSAGEYVQQSIFLTASAEQLEFSLPVTANGEIVSVDNVQILEDDSKERKGNVIKAEFRSGIKLRKYYKYLPEEVGNYGATKNPCTLDINHSFAYFEIDPKYTEFINVGTKLQVTFTVKRNKLRIAGNSLGDLFLDARNIVMRANNNSSYMGLFSNGDVKIGGASVEIGDRLHGHILTNRGGVELDAGITKTARVVEVQGDESYYSAGPITLFYITDELPLFCYDAVKNEYSIIDSTFYLNLNFVQRCDIQPRTFAPDDAVSSFTEKKASELVEKVIASGGQVLSYGELKCL